MRKRKAKMPRIWTRQMSTMPVAWLKLILRFLAEGMAVEWLEPATVRWLPAPFCVDTVRVRLPIRRSAGGGRLQRMVLPRGGGGWRP